MQLTLSHNTSTTSFPTWVFRCLVFAALIGASGCGLPIEFIAPAVPLDQIEPFKGKLSKLEAVETVQDAKALLDALSEEA